MSIEIFKGCGFESHQSRLLMHISSTFSYKKLFSFPIGLYQTRHKQRKNHLSKKSLWRNRLARSAVNREDGGSSPPRDVCSWNYI